MREGREGFFQNDFLRVLYENLAPFAVRLLTFLGVDAREKPVIAGRYSSTSVSMSPPPFFMRLPAAARCLRTSLGSAMRGR